MLIVSKGRDKILFAIGPDANRWVEKILNPPSRLTKLGVKSDAKCWVSAGFDRAFRDELKSTGAQATRQLSRSTLAFLKINDRGQLGTLVECFESLPDGVNIWVVWPKGSKAIGQSDVMGLAKRLGFGPSKTAAFDDAHSSMRFARRKSG